MPGANSRKVRNLPSELSSFVERPRELGEVKRLLAESRLVTLTGIGGTGKTRLAVRVAADVRRAFPNGVWFVDLTQLHDPGPFCQKLHNPDVLAHLVRATLGLPERGGGAPLGVLGVLVAQLADRRMLLVLDNCEHLLPAIAILARTLMLGCPGLRIVATGREPLSIAGETLFPVPPLSAPDPRSRPSLAELSRCEAVALFVARAQTSVPGFALTEDNHIAVADLCHRLDGLPLAIELAAAQLRVSVPQQILDRLADRFGSLGRGSRSAPVRQQTLRACMDWSFDLCATPERILWARLAVFVGGFELEAVEGVCADEALPGEDLLDLVAGLVDKSVLIREDVGHHQRVRYRMLETIRDYGQEILIQTGEQAALRRRHRDWYQQLVTRAKAEWISDRQAYWLSRLRREHPNLRAAIEYCLTEPGEAAAALRIALTLPFTYWTSQAIFGEGRRWLDRALDQYTAPTDLHARALMFAGYSAILQGDVDVAARLHHQAHDLAQLLGLPTELAFDAFVQAMGAIGRDDMPAAAESCERGLAILSRAPQPELEVRLVLLGMLGLAGDRQRAHAANQEILAITEPFGEGVIRSYALWALGLEAWRQGKFHEAASQVRDGLRIKQAQAPDDRHSIGLWLEVLAWIAASQQQARRAANLLGAADALWTHLGTPITALPPLAGDHNACERQAHDALGDAAYDQAFRNGQALTYEDAIAYALEQRRQHTTPAPKDTYSPLTRRERQIADLVGQGMSNKDVASALIISQRTAESHVEHILTKLGFSSRAQVAAWTAQQRTDTNNTQYRGT